MVNKPKPGYYASRPKKALELLLLRATKSENVLQANAAKNQLITSNEGFLRTTIQQWLGTKSSIDFDYLLEEARISFLAAIEKYDLSRDISIRTYAKYYLKELQRKTFRRSKFIELQEEHYTNTYYLLNPDFKSFDLKKTILDAMGKVLSKIEKQVIYLQFFKGLKKRQIAAERNCSESRICFIAKNALPKLKKHLKTIGITPGFLELN